VNPSLLESGNRDKSSTCTFSFPSAESESHNNPPHKKTIQATDATMKTPSSSFLLFLLFSTPWQFVQGQILNNENVRTAIDLWINNNSVALPMCGNIGTWDTSNVTSLNLAFWSTSNFADDLSNWDVTRVTSMQSIFSKVINFNADVSKW